MKNMLDYGLLVLRVGVAGLMVPHGWSKLNKLIAGLSDGAEPVQFYDFMGIGAMPSLALAVMGEFVAPLLILVGWKTRYAAVPAAFTMGVAAFGAHWGEGLGEMEHALLFLFPFAALALTGGGRFGWDKK